MTSGPDYYNEIDEYAAVWLRNLIAAGVIPPGEVDTRSIEDVHPADLKGFRHCHFFAGVGVWAYALQRAGWPDDRPVWTGSCPCQPFSAAGKGAGFADERHLWPAFYHLIGERRPASILGEQVASKDADAWIDLVQDDLEGLGYRVGAIPFPAASVGAPNIRDRTYWVADANLQREPAAGNAARVAELGRRGISSGLADPDGRHAGAERQQRGGEQRQQPQDGGRGGVASGGLDDADNARLEGLRGGHQAEGGRIGTLRSAAEAGESVRMADTPSSGRGRGAGQLGGVRTEERLQAGADGSAGPTNGFWRDADWLGCRDGKWRPVEPGTFPLAHGAPARVGRLRAYGNAINAEAARVFIECVMRTLNNK